MNNQFDKVIILIYLGLIAYLIYKLYKSNSQKKNLKVKLKAFPKDLQQWSIFFLDF